MTSTRSVRAVLVGATVGLLAAGSAWSQGASTDPDAKVTPPPEAKVYFIAPAPNARTTSPVTVQFGLRNMGVTQAGSTAKNAGHHHLLVDAREPLAANEPIPADKNHLHFGGGQTETRVELPPGRHTLQLVLGDARHRLFEPSVQTDKIDILVVAAQPPVRRRVRPHRRRRYG